MKLLFKYIFATITLFWVILGFTDPLKVPINHVFSLALGQSASIKEDKVIIKFKAVLEDSRCPVDAICMWAGNGKVEFELLDKTGQSKTFNLNTEEEPKFTIIEGYELKLLSLNPHRIYGTSILPKDYSATIHIEGN